MDQVGVLTGPHTDDLAQLATETDTLMRLADDLTSMTLHASIDVKVKT
jgi:hypothetical protein